MRIQDRLSSRISIPLLSQAEFLFDGEIYEESYNLFIDSLKNNFIHFIDNCRS